MSFIDVLGGQIITLTIGVFLYHFGIGMFNNIVSKGNELVQQVEVVNIGDMQK